MARKRTLLSMIAVVLIAPDAYASTLVPHQAVYDLVLTSKSFDLIDGEGRIAIKLRRDTCSTFDVDYRFVASFAREDATVVTDQQTVTTENTAENTFAFTTKTYVDGAPESIIQGKAVNEGSLTKVTLEEPESQSFDIPLSVFPSAHTMALIDKARAGERLVETKLYDGDNEAGKLLTTTAIITPVDTSIPPDEARERRRDGNSLDPREALAGLRAWRVSESYYNSDSDVDGLPLFQSNFVLYENGVSDDLTLDNGDYAFSGGLTKLDLLALPNCDQNRQDD